MGNVTKFTRVCSALLLLLPLISSAASFNYQPAQISAPAPLQEFRGAWVATVANIDWPSKPGLPVAQQKAELLALLDHAVQLKLNAIIFQVRPSSDAVYASQLEPWSEYLTGQMGQAPRPAYDPLAFAIAEAHRRGLELHAWFNPFRAHHSQAKSPVSPNHISRTHPELVRQYGNELDLDPGEPAVRAHVLRVIMDVVNRYDVDGVQFDDYFYPYPIKDALKRDVDFPDLATWQKYGAGTGLDRANWRRRNINVFVQNVYTAIKAAKPWVKFGISPFGIWRPFNPPSVRGFDSYAKLSSDSRLWLANGWVDYLSPQLYWPVASREQSFPALLQWWQSQNVLHRHIWPGVADYRTGPLFATDEIARQINVTRELQANGVIHFHLRNLFENHPLNDSLRSVYAEPALVPASPWLGAVPPAQPLLRAAPQGSGARVYWGPGMIAGGSKPVWHWVLQARFQGVWQTEILPGQQTSWIFVSHQPEAVMLRAADRLGNLSAAASVVWVRRALPGTAGHRAM